MNDSRQACSYPYRAAVPAKWWRATMRSNHFSVRSQARSAAIAPNGAAALRISHWIARYHPQDVIPVLSPHVSGRPYDLVERVVREQSMQQILFVPTALGIDHPVLRVIKGQENIVKVNIDAGPQVRQGLQAEIRHV